MSNNAKNELQELYQAKGWTLDWEEVLEREPTGLSGGWRSTCETTLPDGRRLFGVGENNNKRQADIAAIRNALDQLTGEPDEDPAVMRDAQPGDVLIKLAAYVMLPSASPEERSAWLQRHESDAALAALFDRWQEEGDEELAGLGSARGAKFKASMVEALIWRRSRERVLGPQAADALAEVFAQLQSSAPGHQG